jgi:hypothetical protein
LIVAPTKAIEDPSLITILSKNLLVNLEFDASFFELRVIYI